MQWAESLSQTPPSLLSEMDKFSSGVQVVLASGFGWFAFPGCPCSHGYAKEWGTRLLPHLMYNGLGCPTEDKTQDRRVRLLRRSLVPREWSFWTYELDAAPRSKSPEESRENRHNVSLGLELPDPNGHMCPVNLDQVRKCYSYKHCHIWGLKQWSEAQRDIVFLTTQWPWEGFPALLPQVHHHLTWQVSWVPATQPSSFMVWS